VNQFSFRGFHPEPETAINAQNMLIQLISLNGDVIDTSAQLEQIGSQYTCIIEIRTKQTSFSESSSAPSPLDAINIIDQKLRCLIMKWHKTQQTDPITLTDSISAFEKQELGSI
jgi:hypothetical protein